MSESAEAASSLSEGTDSRTGLHPMRTAGAQMCIRDRVIIDEVTRGGSKFTRKGLYIIMVKFIAPAFLLILLDVYKRQGVNAAYSATGGEMESASELIGRAVRELSQVSGYDLSLIHISLQA